MSERRHDYGSNIREYLGKDLADTYGQGEAAPTVVDEALLKDLDSDGFVIVPEVFSRKQVAEVLAALEPLFDKPGRTGIEGFATKRVYGVLAKTRACDRWVDAPVVQALLAHTLAPNPLLSQLQGIRIEPGEKAQPLHTDDMIYPSARPRPPLSTATIIGLDDFTADNGATMVIPGSHTWGERDPNDDDTRVVAEMPAGSVLYIVGSIWHGAGANKTEAPRRALTAQYCQPWLRTQENIALGTPKEVVRELSSTLQHMLGYHIHPPFMGMVNGLHPKRLLEQDG